jgi:hypothetical protein
MTHPVRCNIPSVPQRWASSLMTSRAECRRRHQPRFADEDWRGATTEEKSAAWSSYFGYFGTYHIDEESHAVVHHIERSHCRSLR